MPNKTRFTGNLVSNNNIFSDINNNRVGIGSTIPTEKFQVNGYISIDNRVSYGTTTVTTSSVSQVGIHSVLPITTYRTVEYTIQAARGTDFHATKILSIHNGTLTYNSEYGTVFNNVTLADYDVDISGGNMRLLATPASSGITTYRVLFNAVKI